MNEAALLAASLARNCGYWVFPCNEDKSPCTPTGFKNAEREPDRIAELWHRYPGPLIGIATGERSNLTIVDVDAKHDQARHAPAPPVACGHA
jgi:hypothetical protein